jgi:hypothetical protein
MDMSKRVRLLALTGILALTGCQNQEAGLFEDPADATTRWVLTMDVAPASGGKVDWNREADFLNSAATLERLALQLEIDAATLRNAIRFEFDVQEEQTRVIVSSESAEDLAAISQGIEELYLEFRNRNRNSLAGQQKEDMLEQDRMTYQKALEAFLEEPTEDTEVTKDGVLFQKDQDE